MGTFHNYVHIITFIPSSISILPIVFPEVSFSLLVVNQQMIKYVN